MARQPSTNKLAKIVKNIPTTDSAPGRSIVSVRMQTGENTHFGASLRVVMRNWRQLTPHMICTRWSIGIISGHSELAV